MIIVCERQPKFAAFPFECDLISTVPEEHYRRAANDRCWRLRLNVAFRSKPGTNRAANGGKQIRGTEIHSLERRDKPADPTRFSRQER